MGVAKKVHTTSPPETVVVLRVLLSENLVPPTELYGRGSAAFWVLECGTHWQVCSSVDAPTTSEPGRNRKANGSHKIQHLKTQSVCSVFSLSNCIRE